MDPTHVGGTSPRWQPWQRFATRYGFPYQTTKQGQRPGALLALQEELGQLV